MADADNEIDLVAIVKNALDLHGRYVREQTEVSVELTAELEQETNDWIGKLLAVHGTETDLIGDIQEHINWLIAMVGQGRARELLAWQMMGFLHTGLLVALHSTDQAYKTQFARTLIDIEEQLRDASRQIQEMKPADLRALLDKAFAGLPELPLPPGPAS